MPDKDVNNQQISQTSEVVSIYFTYIDMIKNTVFNNEKLLQELEYLRYCLYGLNEKRESVSNNNKKNKISSGLEFQMMFDFLLFDYILRDRKYSFLEDVIDLIEDVVDPSHVPYMRKWVLENRYSIFKIGKIDTKNQEIEITDVLYNKTYYTSIILLSKFQLIENGFYFGRVLPGKRLYDFYIHHDITFNNQDELDIELTKFLAVINNILENTYSKKLNPVLVHFVFVERKDIPVFLKFPDIVFPDIGGIHIDDPKSKAILTTLYQFVSNEFIGNNFSMILEKSLSIIDKPLEVFDNKSALELITQT